MFWEFVLQFVPSGGCYFETGGSKVGWFVRQGVLPQNFLRRAAPPFGQVTGRLSRLKARTSETQLQWQTAFHIIFSIFSSLVSGLDMKTNSDIPRRVRCNNLATVPLFGEPFFGVSRTKTHSGGFCHVVILSLTCCLNFIVTSTHCIKLKHLEYHLIASFIHLNLSMLRIVLWNAMLKREFLKSPNSTDPVMIISRHRRAINPFMTCFLCLMCREGWLTPAMYSDNALDRCIELQT
jgi:hypothetical protein